MTSELTQKMAKIISQNILTPVIYMLENDDVELKRLNLIE